MREKGTDRGRFFRGEVDKYTWQDIGSSFLPGDITAAFLWAQFEEAQRITRERLAIWQRYHEMLATLERQGMLRRYNRSGARRIVSPMGTYTTSFCQPTPIGRGLLPGSRRTESTRCFTMYRCTHRRQAYGSDARTEILR